MGERKVVSKYIPADFDPALVPRGKKLSSKDGTVPVRMMLPFSLQCATCHTFQYRGRKFNSKKEAMGGPDGNYLGIKRWRFYIKCTHCSRPITFLTDPKHGDYEMESGGTRTYEINKDRAETEEDAAQETEKQAKEDPLKALEARVLDSQREMADLDNLEEIKAMNARHLKLLAASSSTAANNDDSGFGADARAVLEATRGKSAEANIGKGEVLNEDGLTAQDEALVKSIQFGKRPNSTMIRRLDEKDEQRLEEQRRQEAARVMKQQQDVTAKSGQKNKSLAVPVIKVLKRKRKVPPPDQKEELEEGTSRKESKVEADSEGKSGGGALASLLGGYGSDSDSE